MHAWHCRVGECAARLAWAQPGVDPWPVEELSAQIRHLRTERAIGGEHAVARLNQVRRAAALGTDLHDAAMLPRGGHHGLAFDDIDADRLLHVNIGPGLDRGDHRQRVPVVRRGHEHDVEILLGEHLAIVAIGARLLLGLLPGRHHVGGLAQHVLIDIAERHDVDRRNLNQPKEVTLAVPTAADQADALLLLRGDGAGRASGQGRVRQSGSARLEERATMHGPTLRPR